MPTPFAAGRTAGSTCWPATPPASTSLIRHAPTSPIREPVAGCLLRFTPDLKQSEIVADGFRNAYDFDFNPDGELFTYDSDNERCVALPWYEPTRFYHVIPGGRHGWLSPQRGTFWRMPPYFADVVAPLATLERGSPTGCVCYRHVQFPAEVSRRLLPGRLDLRPHLFRGA